MSNQSNTAPNEMSLSNLGSLAKAEIAAGDNARNATEVHYRKAGAAISAAKARLPDENGGTFKLWLEQHGIGKSRAFDLIAIAEGRKTLKEVQKRSAQSMARTREARKAAVHGPQRCGPQEIDAAANENSAEPVGAGRGWRSTQQQLIERLAEKLVDLHPWRMNEFLRLADAYFEDGLSGVNGFLEVCEQPNVVRRYSSK